MRTLALSLYAFRSRVKNASVRAELCSMWFMRSVCVFSSRCLGCCLFLVYLLRMTVWFLTPCYVVFYLNSLPYYTHVKPFPVSLFSYLHRATYAILSQRNYIHLPRLIQHSLNSFTLPFNYLLSTILHHKESNIPSLSYTTLASQLFPPSLFP